MADFCFIKGRHCLVMNDKEITRGENGGILVMDKISESLSELPMSPEVLSFFDISVTDENTFEETGMNSSCSNSDQNSESSNLNAAAWDDKAVKLLFSLYADHQDDFKSTAVKNNVVWDKIKMEMNIHGYNFTRTQIKDKWTNMRKAYMRVKDHNKGTGVTPKSYRYYQEMDSIYGDKPNVNPVAIASNIRAEDDNILSSDDSAIDRDNRKRKKSKVEHQLSSWTEKFIQHSKEREQRNETRQAEKIIAIENATKTFREMMEKLIEKL